MRQTHIVGISLALLLNLPVMAQAIVSAKQVIAPPADITSGLLKLPDPVELGVTSRSLLIEIDPGAIDADPARFQVLFPLLNERGGRVVLLPAEPGAWDASVRTLDGRSLRTGVAPRQAQGMSRVDQALPWGDPGRMFECFTINDQGGGGVVLDIDLSMRIGGYVLVSLNPDAALYTYVQDRSTLVDQPITLVSSISDGSRISRLHADIRTPNGQRMRVFADPGADRVVFTPSEPGKYAVRVEGEYSDGNIRPIRLSTQHLIEVEAPTTPLGAPIVTTSNDRIEISFEAADSDDRTILAAELWGRSDAGMVPVCWLARVCDRNRSLFVDAHLVRDTGVDPRSLELREVRVHDVDSMVPTQIIDRVGVSIDPDLIATKSNTRGISPIPVTNNSETSNARGTLPGGHRLLLVHGYCSDGNPFTTSHFTGDVAVFHDPAVSRSHDAFALEIMAQASPMKSFGIAAHSQGAMAALHLYTFYFSGLDWARGDRLIQSVGAPYQGTALAGNAAVLGDVFGFGCGENPDMTYTGAANWLSLIPTSSRQQVWYYTTSFEDRPFVYDYCNFFTDLLLDDPDDGVIERDRGQLPGATNMGHTEGWCHTTGMRDPAQCTDASRNAIINARARR